MGVWTWTETTTNQYRHSTPNITEDVVIHEYLWWRHFQIKKQFDKNYSKYGYKWINNENNHFRTFIREHSFNFSSGTQKDSIKLSKNKINIAKIRSIKQKWLKQE